MSAPILQLSTDLYSLDPSALTLTLTNNSCYFLEVVKRWKLIICFVVCSLQKEVEAELDRLVGQEGTIHTKMLALQRMGYSCTD